MLFNLASLFLGYFADKLGGLNERENRAIAFEIGVYNGTLAIYLALTVLNNSAMSIPAAIYSLIMFFTAATPAQALEWQGLNLHTPRPKPLNPIRGLRETLFY